MYLSRSQHSQECCSFKTESALIYYLSFLLEIWQRFEQLVRRHHVAICLRYALMSALVSRAILQTSTHCWIMHNSQTTVFTTQYMLSLFPYVCPSVTRPKRGRQRGGGELKRRFCYQYLAISQKRCKIVT